MAGRYVCWGEDHDDLTDQVKDSWAKDPFFGYTGSQEPADPQAPAKWTVVVTCSSGHENAFSGNGRP
jgi:hypothetical protein